MINEYFGITAPSEVFECPDLNTATNVIIRVKVTEWEKCTIIKASMTTSLHTVSSWIPTFLRQNVTPTTAGLIYSLGRKKVVNFRQVIFDNLASLVDLKNA